MKFWTIFIILLITTTICLATTMYLTTTTDQTTTPEHSRRSVVLICWDGVKRSVFLELLNAGKLPFIKTLTILNHTCNVEYGAETLTAPQHGIMLTGYLANVTGITTNDGTHAPTFPSLPLGLTVFEKASAYFSDIRTFGGVAKSKWVGATLGFQFDDFNEHTYFNMRGFDVFDSNDAASTIALARYKPYLTNAPFYLYFIHFNDPDNTGHEYGADSSQYRTAIRACDSATSEVARILASSNPYIIVTSDHGFLYYSHNEESEDTFLATNFPVNRKNSEMADVTTTIYRLLGMPLNGVMGKSLI